MSLSAGLAHVLCLISLPASMTAFLVSHHEHGLLPLPSWKIPAAILLAQSHSAALTLPFPSVPCGPRPLALGEYLQHRTFALT